MHSRREAARTFRTSASNEPATIVGAHATFNDELAPSPNEPYFDLSVVDGAKDPVRGQRRA